MALLYGSEKLDMDRFFFHAFTLMLHLLVSLTGLTLTGVQAKACRGSAGKIGPYETSILNSVAMTVLTT